MRDDSIISTCRFEPPHSRAEAQVEARRRIAPGSERLSPPQQAGPHLPWLRHLLDVR